MRTVCQAGAVTVVPTVQELTTLPGGAASLDKVDVALLKALQDAKRADKASLPFEEKAAAWEKLAQYPGDHAYKELTMPPTADGGWAMPQCNALHIWPRHSFMMIALPNPDRSYTLTHFLPWREAWHGPALRCAFEGRLVAGFRLSQQRADTTPQRGTAWVASPFAGAPPIPVRVEVPSRWFGQAVAVMLRAELSAPGVAGQQVR